MPLRRLKDLYLLQDGVRFLMADNEGSTVICRVSLPSFPDMGQQERPPWQAGGSCRDGLDWLTWSIPLMFTSLSPQAWWAP
jgi:hypothetical protein